jgi:DNA-directed RNA polymerase specialized sigma24 family protein
MKREVASPFDSARNPAQSSEANGSLMPETRWSLVQRIQTDADAKALGEIMKIYWQPLQRLAIGRGVSPSDAEDAVQSFYEMVIRRGSFQVANADRGRLRTFLRTLFERHLIDQWEKSAAAKRGGGKIGLSIEEEQSNGNEIKELSHQVTPELLYDRCWVLTLLGRAMDALRDSYRRRGKEELFEELKYVLEGQESDSCYAESAARLGLNENAVKQAAFRIRKKFGEALTWEVTQTVGDPADIESELRELLQTLAQ